jgi:hypothetical protein
VIGHGGAGQPRGSNTPRRRPSRHQARSMAAIEARPGAERPDPHDDFPDVSGDAVKLADLDQLKSEAKDKFGDGFIEYSVQSHSRPMRQVLGALPFDELAELAETLVLLESLKERVTSSSASVSGPIDVAVISKNDGFIWVKRKHYFDPQLNPRYFAKRGLTGDAQ